MNLAGRNHPCGRKELAGDESWPEESIPAEEKSMLGMNLTGRNNPCEEKEHAGDETGRKKASLRKKKASWG